MVSSTSWQHGVEGDAPTWHLAAACVEGLQLKQLLSSGGDIRSTGQHITCSSCRPLGIPGGDMTHGMIVIFLNYDLT